MADEVKEERISSLLTIPVNDKIPGYGDAVKFPNDPDQWVNNLKKSIEEIGYIQIQFDTLAGGCGGCAIAFSDYGARAGFNDLEGGGTFGFVLSRKEMEALKKVVDFCLETMK